MSYESDLSFNYFGPTRVVFEVGAIRELPMEVGALGTRAVLVTDPGIVETGLVDQVKAVMDKSLVGVYSDVPQDSGMDVVDKASEFALSKGADVIVSMGGGSVIDTAKGMSIVMTEGGKLTDYQGVQLLERPQTPHIVVPTTAGTGSEVTHAGIILDREQGQKLIFTDYFIAPRVAILDPKVTEKLPPHLTASTGMDAMTHAVEAYTAQMRNPISDALSLHAIRLIVKYLPIAVENGSDLTARGQMQIAALIAGWSFINAMVGLVHAMAHSLGAVCGIPHGVANGLLLAHVMRYNLEEVPELTADIGATMGIDVKEMSPIEAGEATADRMEEFSRKLGVPQKLGDLGVAEESLRQCAELSMSDGAIVYNPRMIMESDEVLDIYMKAL